MQVITAWSGSALARCARLVLNLPGLAKCLHAHRTALQFCVFLIYLKIFKNPYSVPRNSS